CRMFSGTAQRAHVPSAADLSRIVEALATNQAIALGSLREDLVDGVPVVTKRKLNGDGAIARVRQYIDFHPRRPAWALIDHDTKDMPAEIKARIARAGGFVQALRGVLRALDTALHVVRSSTSSGIYRTDNAEPVPGSNGVHVFVAVRDGADVDRFLQNLHDR